MRERGRYALATDDDDARTTTQSGEERAGGTNLEAQKATYLWEALRPRAGRNRLGC